MKSYESILPSYIPIGQMLKVEFTDNRYNINLGVISDGYVCTSFRGIQYLQSIVFHPSRYNPYLKVGEKFPIQQMFERSTVDRLNKSTLQNAIPLLSGLIIKTLKI